MERWTFRTLPAELANTEKWRRVDLEALAEEDRQRFINYYNAITSYLKSGRISAVARSVGLDRHEVIRQLNRCVATAPDGHLYGWTAVLRGKRIQQYSRKAALPQGNGFAPGGRTGAFSLLLDTYPTIRETLERLILKKGRSATHEAKISAKSLHKSFLDLCGGAGIRADQYPFNSKSRGRRSVERFMEKVLLENPETGCLARHGQTARSHLNVGRGIPSVPYALDLYDVVGLDPHKLHCIGSVRVPGPRGLQRIAIQRIWIVPLLDEYSRAILGYSVGVRQECSATTIEQAIISAMSIWKPRTPKVPDLRYLEGAGLPSGLFPGLAAKGWTALTIDNAATHYSNAVAERARRRIGCFINYGPVGHWEHRAALERIMKTLEVRGFQRLPSSTGSNASDPIKQNPARAAVEACIDWEELLDLVDIELSNYNVTQHETLGNRSPLSIFRDHWLVQQIDFLPRGLPPPTPLAPELGVAIETKSVRGRFEEGRRPYVEIDRVHYTSPILSGMFGLIGKHIRLHIREADMRTVVAYCVNGDPLGVLTAQGVWGQVSHSREMRKEINALRDSGQLSLSPGVNPIAALLSYYAKAARMEVEKKPFKVSKSATKLVRTALTSETKISSLSNADDTAASGPEPTLNPTTPRPLSRLVKQPVWKTVVK